MSKWYPSRGGSVTFVNRALGTGLFSGGVNVLLWVSYIVMLALYTQAFGSYTASFMPSASLTRHDGNRVWVQVQLPNLSDAVA